MTENEVTTICPNNRGQWREWLQKHHDKEQSVWLIYHKKKSGKPTISWSEAVDEALCFGWIDSLAKPLDEDRFMQFFCRRKAKSTWSKINKDKIDRLVAEGLMAKAGMDIIEIAKQNGSWTILDDVEALVVPADLEKELLARPNAPSFFENLSRSDKRHLLQWLVMARRPETRLKRIIEIAELADQNLKPKILQRAKKPTDG